MSIRFFSTCYFLFISSIVYSQNFEGEVIYANSFKSKIKNLTDEQLGMIVGVKQEYLIKEGYYKSFLNGKLTDMQLYDFKTNRVYNRKLHNDTLYWFDASVNTDAVISFEIKEKAATILGNQCDAIIMKTRTGTTTVYYASLYKIDSKAFAKHNYSNWAFFADKVGCLPLKTVIESPEFIMESTATEITKMDLGDEYFTISPKTPIKKSN